MIRLYGCFNNAQSDLCYEILVLRYDDLFGTVSIGRNGQVGIDVLKNVLLKAFKVRFWFVNFSFNLRRIILDINCFYNFFF